MSKKNKKVRNDDWDDEEIQKVKQPKHKKQKWDDVDDEDLNDDALYWLNKIKK